MKKILFVINTLTGGGAERVVSNLTTDIPEDIHVDILLNSISNTDYETKGNIITLNMKPVKKKGLFYQFRAAAKRYFVLKRLKKKGGYDACISFMDSANILNIITGNKYTKNIISVRVNLSQYKNLKYKLFVFPFVKYLYNKANLIVTPSVGVKLDLIHNFNIKESLTKVIYNGYDFSKINRLANEDQDFEYSKNVYSYINSGRYCDQKAQANLIRAFRKVLEAYPNSILLLLGEGENRGKYETMINDAGLQNNIKLLGFQTNPFKYLIKADCFVFPSISEGFPNAMSEAMACGLPIIASDFKSGAREILAPSTDLEFEQKDVIEYAEYGIIVPVCYNKSYSIAEPLDNSEINLAEAMIEIQKDHSLHERYSKISFKRIQSFSIEQMRKEWYSLVE